MHLVHLVHRFCWLSIADFLAGFYCLQNNCHFSNRYVKKPQSIRIICRESKCTRKNLLLFSRKIRIVDWLFSHFDILIG